MPTTNCIKFKGEVENYLRNRPDNPDIKFNGAFRSLNFRTWLCRSNITKKDGYSAHHLLFVLLIMPLLRVKTVNSFCKKCWQQWSLSKKDSFYRFKHNTRYRWRSFMHKINAKIFKSIDLDYVARKERYFVIDDTIVAKLGRKIENISYIFDHNRGRSVLGYCIVTMGLFTPHGFYPIDFAYRFGKKRHTKSPEVIGDPRKSSGLRSYEAKHYSKLELALQMIQRAVENGIIPGYVMFDSWYACPSFIVKVLNIKKGIHVICRLKKNRIKYKYRGNEYTLTEIYHKVKKGFTKDRKTGLLIKRVKVKIAKTGQVAVIVFSKGYREPEVDAISGRKKKKDENWVAFLSTDTQIHSATVIKKYVKRWPIEVCFKECKQMLDFGKEQSNDFNAQVFATTASFLRYNILNYLNKHENHTTLGELFEYISDESAAISYAQRLWEFFRGLFLVSFSTIFDLFKINEDFQCYFDALSQTICEFTSFEGCET